MVGTTIEEEVFMDLRVYYYADDVSLLPEIIELLLLFLVVMDK